MAIRRHRPGGLCCVAEQRVDLATGFERHGAMPALPIVVSLEQYGAAQSASSASFGKMPTTSARRFTSLLSHSKRLVLCSLVRRWAGNAMRACAQTAVGGGDRLPMARGGADGRDHARLGEDGCQAYHHAKRGDPHGSGPDDQLADMTDDALLEDEAIDRLAEIFCAARPLALPLD
jgi:hypothetical protein